MLILILDIINNMTKQSLCYYHKKFFSTVLFLSQIFECSVCTHTTITNILHKITNKHTNTCIHTHTHTHPSPRPTLTTHTHIHTHSHKHTHTGAHRHSNMLSSIRCCYYRMRSTNILCHHKNIVVLKSYVHRSHGVLLVRYTTVRTFFLFFLLAFFIGIYYLYFW